VLLCFFDEFKGSKVEGEKEERSPQEIPVQRIQEKRERELNKHKSSLFD